MPLTTLILLLIIVMLLKNVENFEEEAGADPCAAEKTEIKELNDKYNTKTIELNTKISNLNNKYKNRDRECKKMEKDLKSEVATLRESNDTYKDSISKYNNMKDEYDMLHKDCNSKLNDKKEQINSLKSDIKKKETFQDNNTTVDTTANNTTDTTANNTTDTIIDTTLDSINTDDILTAIESSITDDTQTNEVEQIDNTNNNNNNSKPLEVVNLELKKKQDEKLKDDGMNHEQILSLLNIDMESILGATKFKKIAEDQIKNDSRQNFRLNRISNILYKF